MSTQLLWRQGPSDEEEEEIVLSSDSSSNETSPCEQLGGSFASLPTSLGADSRMTTPTGGEFSTFPHKSSFTFFETDDELDELDDLDEAEAEELPEQMSMDPYENPEERERRLRRERLLRQPSQVSLEADRHRIAAHRQNQLNNFILRETKASAVSRQDHHIMLRQLVSLAYFRDPQRVQHRPLWKKIVAAVRKEYWGATAIFTLSPDPYHNVLAKLSSMMLWTDDVRHWEYQYCEDELTRRRASQTQVLQQLKASGNLFL